MTHSKSRNGMNPGQILKAGLCKAGKYKVDAPSSVTKKRGNLAQKN